MAERPGESPRAHGQAARDMIFGAMAVGSITDDLWNEIRSILLEQNGPFDMFASFKWRAALRNSSSV